VSSTATATVIIVNYNGAHLLPACLDGLAGQVLASADRTDELSFDTVVVDNASSDGSVELLARDYPWVRVMANADNLGFAGGNNVALREVRTPYAVLLNNDAVPEPGWLANLLAVFSAPGNVDVGIVTGKVLFLPKFAEVALNTEGFQPNSSDTRDLGVRIYGVEVDGVEVSDKILWEQAVYGPEGSGSGRFRWSRPAGTFLVPLPGDAAGPKSVERPVRMTMSVAGERAKQLTLMVNDRPVAVQATSGRSTVSVDIEAGTPVFDVINNAGGQVFAEGSGGDRGFQQVDRGQYDEPAEVFTACGNGMAMRTAIGHEIGWFDDAFFMYYEDTDLSWRWRSAGWHIRYEPSAVLRHIHAASSKEWSPRWVFHVERNRMLMLTKNATADLARAAVGGYLRESLAASAVAARQLLVQRRRPGLRALLLRWQVLGSYSTHLPAALRHRISLARKAHVRKGDLQQWLVPR
jgi:GT2 family glycosyltransferase